MTRVPSNLLRLVLQPRIWSVEVNVPRVPENKVYGAQRSVLYFCFICFETLLISAYTFRIAAS